MCQKISGQVGSTMLPQHLSDSASKPPTATSFAAGHASVTGKINYLGRPHTAQWSEVELIKKTSNQKHSLYCKHWNYDFWNKQRLFIFLNSSAGWKTWCTTHVPPRNWIWINGILNCWRSKCLAKYFPLILNSFCFSREKAEKEIKKKNQTILGWHPKFSMFHFYCFAESNDQQINDPKVKAWKPHSLLILSEVSFTPIAETSDREHRLTL